MDQQSGLETSVNYLALDVLKNCGLPLPSYQSALEAVREEYPVISALQIRDKEGKYLTLEECGQEINDYQSLEYYLLFDYEKQ